MILEDLATYLEENDIGTINTDIFLGELLLDKSDIISLMLSPSPEPNKAIPYYTQYVDVWARFSDFEDGYQKLQDVMDLIQRRENWELDNYHIYVSYALGMIDDMDRDTERRHLFKLSLGFVYRNASVS